MPSFTQNISQKMRLFWRESSLSARVGAVIIALLLVHQLSLFLQDTLWRPWNFPSDYGKMPDFAVYYVGAAAIRSGEASPASKIYDTEFIQRVANHYMGGVPYSGARQQVSRRPPWFTATFIPLTYLSFQDASHIWLLVDNLALLVALILLVLSMKRLKSPLGFLAVALLVVSFGPAGAIPLGNIHNLVFTLLCLVLYLGTRQSWNWAGLLLGLVAAIKVFPILLVFYLFWKKSFRAGLIAMLTFLSLMASGVLAFGQEMTIVWTNSILDEATTSPNSPVSAVYYYPGNESLRGLALRLFTPTPPEVPVSITPIANSPFLAQAVPLVGGALLLLATLYLTRKGNLRDQPTWVSGLELGIFLVLIEVISPLSHNYYRLWLLIPLILLFDLVLDEPLLSLWTIMGLAASYLLFGTTLAFTQYPPWLQPPLIVVSPGLIGMILLWIILAYRLKRQPKTALPRLQANVEGTG